MREKCLNTLSFIFTWKQFLMNPDKAYFAEDNGDWQPIPEWVNFLIRFGYNWGRSADQGRRIALISMPCNSPGAGLITLGAMINDLSSNQANDINSHQNSLFEYARQYLDQCRDCDLLKCDPISKRCGYAKKSLGIIRSIRRKNHLYFISDQTDCHSNKLVLMDKNGKNLKEVNPQYLINHYVDGHAPAISHSPEMGLQKSAYQCLIEDVEICTDNLSKSYSRLVLAGRASGGRDTRTAYEAVHFCNDTESFTLSELLAIHKWSDNKISRTSFFNTRTGKMDQTGAQAKLVVADGGVSFLKSIDTFKKMDVIGVIDRSADRDRLEMVGDRFSALKNWYQLDSQFQEFLPSPVPGITIAILKKNDPGTTHHPIV